MRGCELVEKAGRQEVKKATKVEEVEKTLVPKLNSIPSRHHVRLHYQSHNQVHQSETPHDERFSRLRE